MRTLSNSDCNYSLTQGFGCSLRWLIFISNHGFIIILNEVKMKLLKQGYQYHNFRKPFFSKFYRRFYDLISKFQVGLKSLLGLSESEFYGDLVYKLKKIVHTNNFSAQFIKIISHYKSIGY